MARTALTAQQIVSTGLTPSYGAANVDGHTMPNDGKFDFLVVKNASGGSINVTIPTTVTIDGLAVPDRVVAVANGAEKWIGGLDPRYYNNADGTINIDFSAVTSVTVAYARTAA